MSIKGLLYFNLELLECQSKVFSTSIWSFWNVDQRSSLPKSGVVEMLIEGLLYFNLVLLECRSKFFSTSIWSCWIVDQRSSLPQSRLVEMSIKGFLYFDLKLLECQSKVFSTSIWTCWNVDQSLLYFDLELCLQKIFKLWEHYVPTVLCNFHWFLLDLNFIKKSSIDKRFYFWETFDFLETWKFWNWHLKFWDFETLRFWF